MFKAGETEKGGAIPGAIRLSSLFRYALAGLLNEGLW